MTKKESLKALLVERQRIFNSLDSRFSRYNEKNNSRQIADNTGMSIIEVECVYASGFGINF